MTLTFLPTNSLLSCFQMQCVWDLFDLGVMIIDSGAAMCAQPLCSFISANVRCNLCVHLSALKLTEPRPRQIQFVTARMQAQYASTCTTAVAATPPFKPHDILMQGLQP